MSEVIIKTGKENMDVKMIHHFLKEDSYWAKDISYALVDHSLTHSFCIGAFLDGEQVGLEESSPIITLSGGLPTFLYYLNTAEEGFPKKYYLIYWSSPGQSV